jgi:hypothetical protein
VSPSIEPQPELPHSAAGLAGAPAEAAEQLRRQGIDPHRLSVFRLGRPSRLLWRGYAPWVRTLALGLLLWSLTLTLEKAGWLVSPWLRAGLALATGLLILQAACDALVTATERLAARRTWDHYVAGTLAEILSTLPEFVVIAFVVGVSPVAALTIALVTIYNNALVFSLYSYFLPKNHQGRFLMPKAITEAGTQILIAGAGMGSVIGLLMLALPAHGHPKQSFAVLDLSVLGLVMWGVFGIYVYELLRSYASQEKRVHEGLQLSEEQVDERRELVYEHVKRVPTRNIVMVFAAGVIAAFLGGERVSEFAHSAIQELDLNPIATAVVLAGFAGMSEYVILWRAHRKGQHRIALANAFGGITQVMFLVLPFTLLCIAIYQATGPAHSEIPLQFSLANALLFVFLFPTFYVLTALIEEDHTLGLLDTAIMIAIFVLILLILIVYGGADAALTAG